MNIAVVGVGKVGGALARNWASKGHNIYLGVRNPDGKKEWEDIPNVSVHPVNEAMKLAETILVALPVSSIVPVFSEAGDLSGKKIVDATNSVFQKPEPYANGYEAIVDLTGADVAKGFNSTGFENMADPNYDGRGVDMFTAGDSDQAKSIVKQLSSDAGFENCYDFGGADKVALLEQFAMAWINLAIIQKEGRNIAFKVLKR